MNATLGILRNTSLAADSVRAVADRASASAFAGLRWSPDAFATEQLHGLVRQVFFSGGPRPPRQVVFTAIDDSPEMARICTRVAETLASQVPGNVCVVEANSHSPMLHNCFGGNDVKEMRYAEQFDPRNGAQQIARNLWFVPADAFLGNNGNPFFADHLRSRLSELGRQFEYTLIHASPAGSCSEAALIGQLSDGVILGLEAHRTRRIAARITKERLQAANVRLLGVVLNQRTFPIPEGIYRKL